MRPVTVVFYGGLRGADGAGQGRGSAVQTGFQGLHRSPQFFQIGKAGVQLFPGGDPVLRVQLQTLELGGGAPDGATEGVHRPQRVGGDGLRRRHGQLGGLGVGNGPVDEGGEVALVPSLIHEVLHG